MQVPAPISYNPSFVPTLKEPPIVHAAHKFDDETQTLSYEYNGRKIITMTGQGSDSFGYRHSSDGDIQSWPFTQQLYFLLEEPRTAVVTVHLSSDVVCMRPHRARSEQAILGQVGRPLLSGVNGLYDISQDLQIDWHGRKWRWLDDRLTQDENGELIARLEVELGEMPWFMNLRPQYYRTHLGYKHHKPWEFRPQTGSISGWCSWEAYRRQVTEKDVEGAAEFFAEHFGPYGMKYVQIDDGYEKTPIPHDPKRPIAHTWLGTNAQFPNGHKGVIDKIKNNGMEAGIWTSASLTNNEFVNEQPECIVKDKDGECIEGDWLGFLLDCLPETLDKHVQPYYKGLSEMGYTYFKTDQIRHLLFDGLQKACRMGALTNDEAEERFRAFMQCARDAMGPEAFFLASWGVLSQVTGICDACRIAIDANPSWAGVRMQLVESARWFHTHRILFVNDPDHICARAKLDWARTLISLVSLSGGLFMLSDPLEAYDEDRIRIIQRCLPPLPTVT
jgi:alpha-galactosidase